MTNIFPTADDTRKLSHQKVSSSVAAAFIYGNERICKHILVVETQIKAEASLKLKKIHQKDEQNMRQQTKSKKLLI